MTPPRPQRTTRTPRVPSALPVVVLVLVVALVDVALSVAGGATTAPGPDRLPVWLPSARAGVAAVLLAVLSRVVFRRSRVPDTEHEVWRRFAQGLRCAAVGVALQAVVDTAVAVGAVPDHALLALPFLLSTLVASALAYQGLIVWNRVRTVTADTSDWLNGISAVLVVVAIGALVDATNGAASAWPAWQVQVWLLRLGAGVVLLGAAATVVHMTSRRLDLRGALVLAAPLVMLVGTVVDALLAGRSGYAETVSWVIGGALLAAAAVRTPRPVTPRPATTQEATIGSAVVIGAGVVVLAADALTRGSTTSAVYAVAAVVGAGARVWHLIRDLALLATTRQQAHTDELTGIANRRALMAHLDQDSAAGGALLVLDLDRFKPVNDRWGHGVGDELLRVVAHRLRALLPPGALLARLGGDEFAIVVHPGDGDEPAEALAARVVQSLAAPAVVAGHRLELGASVGVATSGRAGARLVSAELLRRADTAMYVAKAAGGRRVRAYDGAVDAAALDRVQLGEDLREVLSRRGDDGIAVHYQPQVDVPTGAVAGVEALVRWHHPRLGLVAPDDFLPLVEELGLMAELTTRVLTRAAADSELWAPAPGERPLRLAVNLSASCLARPELVPLVERVLVRHPGLADRLVFEVTETAIMSDPEVALASMHQLRAQAVDFSIDDYGTGFASLAYLHDLPAVELKLDRSFTTRLRRDRRTAAIVAGTVELAHQLGMRLVAEGVEDEETLLALAGLGCDETQGYLHARPMPAGDLVAWLTAHRPTPLGPPPAVAPTPPVAAAPPSTVPGPRPAAV